MFTHKWLLTTILVLAGAAVCARLGIWQLDRLTQRRAFNTHYLEASMTTPLVLEKAPAEDLTSMEYRSVSATGRYDPSNDVVLRNQYHDGQPGYFLLTPLILADGTAILIERGWIPADGNSEPTDWAKYDQSGDVTITGIIRLGQSKPDVGGVPDPELSAGQTRLDFWNLVNLERIGRQLPYKILPVFIQPDPDPKLDHPPYPYQPVIEISEGPHMGYALQWFSFSALLLFGYPFFLRKQLKDSTTSDNPENSA
jgi:surfeit locus 1 family protein